jgi:hypothetical protein
VCILRPINSKQPIAHFILFTVVLAGNFSILKGSVSFTVPMVTPDDDYFVVCKFKVSFAGYAPELKRYSVFGDSGNWSGNITINSPFTYY